MDAKISSAIVAGLVSLGVSMVTYFSSIKKMKNENKLFEKEIANKNRLFEKEVANKYNERLYELRLQEYPKAFEITDDLGKGNVMKPEDLPGHYKDIEKQLIEWRTGVVNLIISDKSLEVYYELRKCFKAQLALGNKYSKNQLQRFYNKRCEFRSSLREDMGLLYKVEEEENNG